MLTVRLELHDQLLGYVQIVDRGAADVEAPGDWHEYRWRAVDVNDRQRILRGLVVHNRERGPWQLAHLVCEAMRDTHAGELSEQVDEAEDGKHDSDRDQDRLDHR